MAPLRAIDIGSTWAILARCYDPGVRSGRPPMRCLSKAGEVMPPTLVGGFEQYAQGRGAFDELQRQGFALDELGLVDSDGELVDQVSTLAIADVAGRGLSDVLMSMGVPRAPANQYARHLA